MEKESASKLTYGQKAVGITFNPSGDERVNRIKQLSANLIDEIHSVREGSESSEIKAQATLAIRSIQVGQMWGVKAATWKD